MTREDRAWEAIAKEMPGCGALGGSLRGMITRAMLTFADAEAAAMRERADKALGDAKWKVGGVSIDAMEGDNLAVTLCSRFDDPDGEQDENGWTEAAVDGCDATLAAIHAVYVDALARALPATGEVGR